MAERATIEDTLNRAIQIGFYRHTCRERPEEYLKFIEYGSINCTAVIFNREGKELRRDKISVDGPKERQRYELVPENELPEALKSKIRSNIPPPKDRDFFAEFLDESHPDFPRSTAQIKT